VTSAGFLLQALAAEGRIMAQEPTETRYSITIKEIVSSNAEGSVSLALSQIAKNMTLGQILKRLESLPWTLTKKATQKTAQKVTQVLEKAGATVIVEPPLSKVSATPKPIVPTSISESTPANYVSTKTPSSPVSQGGTAYQSVHGEPLPGGEIVSIEPLSLSGILDRTFQICKGHFWPLIGIMVIPWLAVIVIFMVIGLIAALVGFSAWQTGGKDASTMAVIVIVAVLGIGAIVVAFVLFYLSEGAVIYAVSQVYLGKKFGVKESYRFMWPRAAKFILTSIMLGFVIMGMFITLFIVAAILFVLSKAITGSGLWSAIFWLPLLLIPMYAIPKLLLFDKVIVLEDLAYGEAFKRSWNLTSGQGEGNWPRNYWVKLIVLLHVIVFIYVAILTVFYVPSFVIELAMPKSLAIVGKIIGEIIRNLSGLVAGLFGSVCLVVFYYDIRNRKEGFDLRLATESQESLESRSRF
jgi:MFS family permease